MVIDRFNIFLVRVAGIIFSALSAILKAEELVAVEAAVK